MAAGDLTGSTPTKCTNATEIKAAVDALNLTAATDFIMVVPFPIQEAWWVFKVERAAA